MLQSNIRQITQALVQSATEEILNIMDTDISVGRQCSDSNSLKLEISALANTLIEFATTESLKCINQQQLQDEYSSFAGEFVHSTVNSAINTYVEEMAGDVTSREPESPDEATPKKLVFSKQHDKIQSKWLTEEDLGELDFYDSELESPTSSGASSPLYDWRNHREEKANDGGQTGYVNEQSLSMSVAVEEPQSNSATENSKDWKISTEQLKQIADHLGDDDDEDSIGESEDEDEFETDSQDEGEYSDDEFEEDDDDDDLDEDLENTNDTSVTERKTSSHPSTAATSSECFLFVCLVAH